MGIIIWVLRHKNFTDNSVPSFSYIHIRFYVWHSIIHIALQDFSSMSSVCQNSKKKFILRGFHFESINSFIESKQNVTPFESGSEITYHERKTRI